MKKSLVVIAHATDVGAASVVEHLRNTSTSMAVHVIRPEVLSLAGWSHRVDWHGHAATITRIPGLSPLISNDIAAVLNRIQYVPVPRFQRSSPKDRDYAATELQALLASWLAELGDRVVNSVRRHHWVTPQLSLPQWSGAAVTSGLPVARRCLDTRRQEKITSSEKFGHNGLCWTAHTPLEPITGSVLVAGERVSGPLSHEFGQGCVAVARALGFTLIEFFFTNVRGRWELVDATLFPELETSPKVALVSDLLCSLSGCEYE